MNDLQTPPAPPPPPAGPLARVEEAVGEAVQQVEQRLQHTVARAERSLARRFGTGCVAALRRTLRWTLLALLVAYFAFAAVFLATRHVLLPRVDELRPWLEREASRLLARSVSIERIDAGWRGFHPQLRLSNVQLRNAQGEVTLTLPLVEAVPSWSSLPRRTLRFASLSLVAPELQVERLAAQRFAVAGFVLEPRPGTPNDDAALEWLLDQKAIRIRDATVRYVDRRGAMPQEVQLTELQFGYRHTLARHQFALQTRPPASLAGPIDVRGDFEQGLFERASNLAEWSGRLYAQIDFADMAALEALADLLPPPLRLTQAQGAARLWARIERAQLEELTADLALTDVDAQLGEQLQPLRLASVQGRITQRHWGNARRGGHEVALSGLQLQPAAGEPASLAVPSTDLKLRWTRPQPDSEEHIEFEANRLTLESLSELALHVPLAAPVRQLVARHTARGTLTAVRLSIDGDPARPLRYSARARFEALAAAPQPAAATADGRARPGLPGFDNLSGQVELTEAGGSLQLATRDARLELPGLFEAPLAARQLLGQVRWTTQPALRVQVDNLSLANADLELSGGGQWQADAAGPGPGSIDLSLRLPRLDVAAAARYVPLVAGPQTRLWLKHALVGGQASDGSVRLRGALREFPFSAPASGDFRIAFNLRDAVLDYQSASLPTADGSARAPWPRIDDIDGELLIDRRKLEVTARGSVFDARIVRATARIPDLFSKDMHLLVDGTASGPAAAMVRYVTATPLHARLANFFSSAQATGNARLELKLDIPLVHARDTLVSGAVTLQNNDLVLREDVPPLARASGRVEFTERSLRIAGVTASAVGGSVRVEGGTAPDGAIVVSAAGTATPAGARRLFDLALLQRLLDRAQGSTRYNAVITVRDRRTALRVESDLSGWQIDAPAPLGKVAADPLPLRVEIAPTEGAGERDVLRVGAGTALALQFERLRSGGELRVERGVIAVGTAGERPALPTGGVLATVNLPRLDVDRWMPYFEGLADAPAGSRSGAGQTGGGGMPDFVNARVRQLTVAGKPFANVVLGATRGGDGLWQANVDSDHASGALTWRPGASAAGNRITARLARLTIADTQRDSVAELLDAPVTEVPGFDVTAERFELGGKALGRLELVANNVGRGANAAWQLQKLELTNPDAKMSAAGQWGREPGAAASAARRMTLNLTLEVGNAGALLARLGIPEAVRGGAGRLEGEVTWRGSPFALDYATLSGQLKLNATKGQFLKADAGAGRLLGVLSLQSLPRRITLDFRDVFSEGFAFDSIGASATLTNGVLDTRDFRMRGVSANVLIEGSADLRYETQQLHVLVLPEINAGSASLAYALLANPAIGLGTFLAQLLLRDPLSKAFSFEYDITGSWSDPQVKRRERSAGPVVTPP